MRWWDKSWKEGRRTSRKGSVRDAVTENTDSSTSLHASCFRVRSGRSLAQPVPPQGGHPQATRLVDSSFGRLSKGGQERGSPRALSLCSSFRPGLVVETPDDEHIDMDITTNSPSSLKLKEKAPIPSRLNSRGIIRSSSGSNVLNRHTPPMPTSSSALNLSKSAPLGQVPQNEPLRNPGKSLLRSENSHGHSSSIRDNILYNVRKKPTYRLPLPLATASSSAPVSPLSSTRTHSPVPQSSVQANNFTSPGQVWKRGRLIGSGSYGHVYIGFNCESGEMCAMKEVTIYAGDSKSRESAQQLNQEIALLSQFHHPNIVQYYGSDVVGDNVYIYLEYVSGGSIHKVLQEYGPLGDVALRNFTRQILSGLAYLHAKNTAHRDVKGANLLLQAGGCVKLADFGMAKHLSGECGPMSFKGSPYWIAPEVVKHSNADVSVDIWSLGCTVIEMVSGRPPWHQYEAVAALFKIGNSNELPAIPDYLSEEGKDFVRRCLQRDPLQRPTAAQLLEHPFVKYLPSLERRIPNHEPVEPMHLAVITGNLQSRNPHFTDSGAIHNARGRNVASIRDARSSENTPLPVSPLGNMLRQSQSSPNMSETRLTPMLTPRDASDSSRPIGSCIIWPHDHPQSLMRRREGLALSPLSIPQAASGSLEHLAGANGGV